LFDVNQGVILDVRNPEQFAQGHLELSINKDLLSGRFVDYLTTLRKERPVLIYCNNGTRSSVGLKLLNELGFKDLFHLEQGIKEWDGPIVR
jgi:rhodanese-related sulfurtransferase